MEALIEVLGATLKTQDEAKDTADSLADVSFVGLYFCSTTAEPCTPFTAQLKEAGAGPLSGKGFAVVTIALDDSQEKCDELQKDTSWLALPFDSKEKRDSLVERFEVDESKLPVLVILDAEAQVCTIDGVGKLDSDRDCESFPWKEEALPTLSEDDILEKLVDGGQCPPEADEDGLVGFFLQRKNYIALGVVDELDKAEGVLWSGSHCRPYVEFNRQAALDEVKRMGFASNFDENKKDIEKFEGESILLIYDPKKVYKSNFIMTCNMAAYDREKGRIQELKDAIVKEFEDSLKPPDPGGGGDGGVADIASSENIVVRDLPKTCGEWVSETMVETHKEVENFTVVNARPLMQVMITRARAHFGKAYKFSDSGENLHNCRPQKDPNYALQRKELEIGIQAVKEMKVGSCQTTWFRPVNKSTQYSPSDFLQGDSDLAYDEVHALTEFLTSVSVGVEEALQTNETVDIFQEEFAHLGEEEAGAVSKTHSNLRENRNFADVTYTRGKRIEWVEWVPHSVDMLACSCVENLTFTEKIDNMGKATTSSVLIWSFQDTLSPHAILTAPWEVPVFKFYPSDGKYLIGGLSSGQLAVWKLSDADLGYTMRERNPKGQAEEEKGGGGGSQVPTVMHKQVSIIDESHKKAVMAIEWLPPALEIEKRGRGASEKHHPDGPVKYFLTIAGDGQVMIWDIQALMESINDHDFMWKPVHRVQLQRQDSGTEMGCCHILYCHDRKDEKDNKLLTNFFASTEEGELIFGDWAAKVEDDRKPEYCKKMFTVSKTFRPMLSLERSPFFPEIFLGVTDWAFYLWKDGVKDNLFQSAYTSTYFTRGVWSPTRPSVVFLGLLSGGIDIWDFSDQSHKASLTDTGASVAISSMVFLRHGDMQKNQMLAVGDAHGHLHVHYLPNNLVRPAGRELDNMRKFLEREEERVKYFQGRRQELVELKENMDKQAQMAADKEEAEKGKAQEDVDKADAQAEETYRKLEEECLEQLKTGVF